MSSWVEYCDVAVGSDSLFKYTVYKATICKYISFTPAYFFAESFNAASYVDWNYPTASELGTGFNSANYANNRLLNLMALSAITINFNDYSSTTKSFISPNFACTRSITVIFKRFICLIIGKSKLFSATMFSEILVVHRVPWKKRKAIGAFPSNDLLN